MVGSFFDKLPYSSLLMASLLLGLAPFVPYPHLYEKWVMLYSGNLKDPLDIFDVFFHLAPVILLTVKFGLTQLPKKV